MCVFKTYRQTRTAVKNYPTVITELFYLYTCASGWIPLVGKDRPRHISNYVLLSMVLFRPLVENIILVNLEQQVKLSQKVKWF